MAKQKALTVTDSHQRSHFRCSDVLDAFEDQFAIKIRRERLKIRDNLQLCRIGFEGSAEVLADFQERRTELADERKMRVRDSDVIECEAHPQLSQPLDVVKDRAVIFQRALLRDLQHDPLRVDVVAFRVAQQPIAQLAAMTEDLRMDVHEENRVPCELRTGSESLTHAGELEIQNALLSDRVLEKDLWIAQQVVVAIACKRFIAED